MLAPWIEAMLLKRPMVVCYKLAALTYALASRMLKVPYVALPNLLAGERLVPEFLQDQVTVENLQRELFALLGEVDAGIEDDLLAAHSGSEGKRDLFVEELAQRRHHVGLRAQRRRRAGRAH